ncbi:MAG: hypothetical protein BWY21_01971 [Parcubacteria group bacterium ADurb.Bin216]|nr:MAG: hypothetical protein BWY21_01971 [Parcubacteria group bacterium ADurb.Bin216]
MIVLKNINGKETIRTRFRGRDVIIKPKCSYILKETEEGLAEANYLKQTYGFLLDVTSLIKPEEVSDENKKILKTPLGHKRKDT